MPSLVTQRGRKGSSKRTEEKGEYRTRGEQQKEAADMKEGYRQARRVHSAGGERREEGRPRAVRADGAGGDYIGRWRGGGGTCPAGSTRGEESVSGSGGRPGALCRMFLA